MKLYLDKLDAHLKRETLPIYLLHGEEPWQIMQAADRLRRHAREAGYSEREVIMITADADWETFEESAASLSLFAEQRVIDLRIPTGKPGKKGVEVLKRYAAQPPDDVLLLIQSGKLDGSATRSAWYKAIEKVGGVLASWPLSTQQLRGWLKTRLQEKGLQPDDDALRLLVERVEGNLLAAAQEVDRLALLCPAGQLPASAVLDAVADSARYSLSDLADAALAGDTPRALKALDGLAAEGVNDVLLLWTLSQDIRAATRVAESIEAGVPMERALTASGVWRNRQALMKTAVPRHAAREWLALLAECTRIDRLIKSTTVESVPDALLSLVARICGQPLASSGSRLRIGA